jgi:uncharacterized SAM-dependent methyltransferase
MLDAYDDSLGVTAAFNLNLLARINRELGGKSYCRFRHEALSTRRAMECTCAPTAECTISGAGLTVTFHEGKPSDRSTQIFRPELLHPAMAASFRREQRRA